MQKNTFYYKIYYGSKPAIIIDFVISIIILFFIGYLTYSILNKYLIELTIIALVMGGGPSLSICITRMKHLQLKIDEEFITFIGYTNEDWYGRWNGVKYIAYIPLVSTVLIHLDSGSNLWVGRLFKDRKKAWRDLVLIAQEKYPSIKISNGLIKILAKEQLLGSV